MEQDQLEMYKTPQKSIEVCSVCLSPCGKYVGSTATPLSSSTKRLAVETKCKHHFHETCLNEAKAMKPECPMCRCPLTPLTDDRAAEFPNLMRQAVVSAAQRGRNAVRERMLRMERERAQQETSLRAVE